MESCIFCNHYTSGNIALFEDSSIHNFFYYWDVHPATPGHLLVIPKRHVADHKDLSDGELQELAYAVQNSYKIIIRTDLTQTYRSMLDVFTHTQAQAFIGRALDQLQKYKGPPDGYNHGLNDGLAAGRTVHHLHYHVMPRWLGDVENPRGGIRHMFDGMGNYHEGLKE